MISRWGRRPVPSQAGFTLLEMLVAVTLVAIMAVGLWAIFRTSLRSWARGTEFIDKNQQHRSLMDLVRKQIASAHPLNTPPPSRTEAPNLADRPHLIFSGGEHVLRFISLNSLQFQESPGLTFVSYEVSQDSRGEYSLVEREVRYTGQRSEEEAFTNQAKGIPVFENLSSCQFQYYDPGEGDKAGEWKWEWDGQETGRLPAAIALTMMSHDPQGNSLNRQMVIPIQAQDNIGQLTFMDPFGGGRTILR